MKITKNKLKEIIKEQLVKEYIEPEFSPEEQAVLDAMEQLQGLIEKMGESNPDMTDYYVPLFRALKKAGVNVKAVAMFA